MKTFVKILGLVVLLLAATALLVPMLISVDDITEGIAKQVEKTTGRTLTVEGDKSLSVFPSLALKLNQVHFSNAAGGSQPDMASIENLDVYIPWSSLLSKQLTVERFVINNPDILLEVDSAGKPNWDLLPKTESQSSKSSDAAPTLPIGFDLSLGEVAIYGGSVRLLDHSADTVQSVEELDLTVALPSLEQALRLQGEITWKGEALELNVVVSTPKDALEGKPFDVELTVESRLLDMNYRGSVRESGAQIGGEIQVSGDSVKELANWQGIALTGNSDAYNKFDLSGQLLFAGERLKITELQAKMDALDITGEAEIRLAKQPEVSANIDLGMLDINPYLPPQNTGSEAKPVKNQDKQTQAITWDEAAIDLSALHSVNASINLHANGLSARDITLDESEVHLSLRAGNLNLTLNQFAAYDGDGKGQITIDARRSPFKIATDFDLQGINAQPLLADVMGFDKLLGKGQLQWKLKTMGNSQKEFVSALQGTVGFKLADGAVKGANIAAMVRAGQGLLKGDASDLGRLAQGYNEAEQTDFSEMNGTLTFAEGVGTNKDLTMASPLLRVSGKGRVNLPRSNLDYRLTVRLVKSIEGQGAVQKAKGIEVPMRIRGPLHKIKFELDTKEAVEEKVKDKLKKELLKRFGKKG